MKFSKKQLTSRILAAVLILCLCGVALSTPDNIGARLSLLKARVNSMEATLEEQTRLAAIKEAKLKADAQEKRINAALIEKMIHTGSTVFLAKVSAVPAQASTTTTEDQAIVSWMSTIESLEEEILKAREEIRALDAKNAEIDREITRVRNEDDSIKTKTAELDRFYQAEIAKEEMTYENMAKSANYWPEKDPSINTMITSLAQTMTENEKMVGDIEIAQKTADQEYKKELEAMKTQKKNEAKTHRDNMNRLKDETKALKDRRNHILIQPKTPLLEKESEALRNQIIAKLNEETVELEKVIDIEIFIGDEAAVVQDYAELNAIFKELETEMRMTDGFEQMKKKVPEIKKKARFDMGPLTTPPTATKTVQNRWSPKEPAGHPNTQPITTQRQPNQVQQPNSPVAATQPQHPTSPTQPYQTPTTQQPNHITNTQATKPVAPAPPKNTAQSPNPVQKPKIPVKATPQQQTSPINPVQPTTRPNTYNSATPRVPKQPTQQYPTAAPQQPMPMNATPSPVTPTNPAAKPAPSTPTRPTPKKATPPSPQQSQPTHLQPTYTKATPLTPTQQTPTSQQTPAQQPTQYSPVQPQPHLQQPTTPQPAVQQPATPQQRPVQQPATPSTPQTQTYPAQTPTTPQTPSKLTPITAQPQPLPVTPTRPTSTKPTKANDGNPNHRIVHDRPPRNPHKPLAKPGVRPKDNKPHFKPSAPNSPPPRPKTQKIPIVPQVQKPMPKRKHGGSVMKPHGAHTPMSPSAPTVPHPSVQPTQPQQPRIQPVQPHPAAPQTPPTKEQEQESLVKAILVHDMHPTVPGSGMPTVTTVMDLIPVVNKWIDNKRRESTPQQYNQWVQQLLETLHKMQPAETEKIKACQKIIEEIDARAMHSAQSAQMNTQRPAQKRI
jgi:hypothetical protein